MVHAHYADDKTTTTTSTKLNDTRKAERQYSTRAEGTTSIGNLPTTRT